MACYIKELYTADFGCLQPLLDIYVPKVDENA